MFGDVNINAQVIDTALRAAANVKRKREARGLQPRPVRAVVVGFPNVGKSALINRLVGKRACESAPKPGVTRQVAKVQHNTCVQCNSRARNKHMPTTSPPRAQLKWVRLGADLDMLDAPGVLPMSFHDQLAAQRLAICNDIGEASYVDSLVAAALLETLRELPGARGHCARLQQRYGVALSSSMTGEDYVHAGVVSPSMCTSCIIDTVGDAVFLGDVEKAGARVLKDYRTGALGWVCLEPPPRQV